MSCLIPNDDNPSFFFLIFLEIKGQHASAKAQEAIRHIKSHVSIIYHDNNLAYVDKT
jgi:hypothetical protein